MLNSIPIHSSSNVAGSSGLIQHLNNSHDLHNSPPSPFYKMTRTTDNNSMFSVPPDYLSLNAVNSSNSLMNNSLPCVTPVIGQKRLQRRNNSSSSFTQKQSPNDNDISNSEASTSGFNSETRNILNGNDSILLSSSMSTLNKNMTLNSQNSTSPSSSTSPTTSSTLKITIPKSPKPQRTLAIFDCVIIGLNSSLNDLRTKVADLTSAVTNGYNAMAKQLLQSESYLRHLEGRISTLLKLQNSYTIHLKMKEGIQNMYEAYKKSPGNQQKNLANIKLGWKDCIQKLCAIEAQTEAMLGTFQFQIEKLIGFARLCPGDTYELLIKYGSNSKFRTRTKIGKDGSQAWDCSKFSFKITVQDLLLIRINEIKFLGKNLLIGERICDTRDLFSTTQTQRLTLNANISGTLKLSMLITWLPFENCEEAFIYYNPTQYLTMNTKEKRLSSYTMTKLASNNNSILNSSNISTNNLNNSLNTRTSTLPLSNHHNHNFMSNTLQFRPTSLQVDTNYKPNYTQNTQNVLTAITDTDDTDFDPSAASSSSSTSSSSSGSKKNNENNETNENIATFSSNKSKKNDSERNSSSNIDENENIQLSFCSSTSNLSNSVSGSHANTSHNLCHEDFHVFSDVEKCLDSILNNLDDLKLGLPIKKGLLISENNNNDNSKCSSSEYNMRGFNLIKLVEDLFLKLQYRLDNLRAQYIELNELHEQSQSYEILIKKLVKKEIESPKSSIKKEVIPDEVTEKMESVLYKVERNSTISTEENSTEDSDSNISVVLDDLMQYFDFLDEPENNCNNLENKIHNACSSVIDVENIDITNLPSDFNHFLIRHFSHCIQLLDDLKFLNKNQQNTSFKLNRFESIIFEKLMDESNIMRNFLRSLITLNNDTNSRAKNTFNNNEFMQKACYFNPLIIEILEDSLLQNNENIGSEIWLKSININENLTDKCILNAEKSSLIINLSDSLEISNKNLLVNKIINKLTHSSSITYPPDEEQEHTSISVYHFCALYNLITSNRKFLGELSFEIGQLNNDTASWYGNFAENTFEIHRSDKIFGEVFLGYLIHMILAQDKNARTITEKYIDQMSKLNLENTIDMILSVTLEALLNLKNKSNQTNDLEVLRFLVETLKNIINISEENCESNDQLSTYLDYSLIEFICLQIANHENID